MRNSEDMDIIVCWQEKQEANSFSFIATWLNFSNTMCVINSVLK